MAPAAWESDPKRSALNGFCQMHDVKNLFVVDGSAFPGSNRKKSHADDIGFGLAIHRLSGRRTEKGEFGVKQKPKSIENESRILSSF